MKLTFRAARVLRGFTLKEVARATGRSIDTIARYEKDSSNIPRDLLVAQLELYGVTLDDIYFGKESDFIGRFRSSHRVVPSCS